MPDSQLKPAQDDAARRLREELVRAPYRFEFFQAVRLLSVLAAESAATDGADDASPAKPVGEDFPPKEEVVRFAAHASHSFPPGEVSSLKFEPPRGARSSEATQPPRMEVTFMGLTGPAGALPQHYTQTILDRQRFRDRALREFLDLFNHRFVSHFYRAWEKYHVPALLESKEHAAELDEADPFTYSVYCLVGLGTPGTRRRLEFTDRVFLYYSGLFAQYPRSAVALERLVADFIGAPVQLLQFQGQWLTLQPSEQTRMTSSRTGPDANHQLGVTAIAGERVWSVDTRFRIRLGPLSYDAFCSLLPGGQRLVELSQLIRTFAGPELDFDLQPVLHRAEVPPCALSEESQQPPRLGFNTWICTQPMADHAEDAVFVCEGRPDMAI